MTADVASAVNRAYQSGSAFFGTIRDAGRDGPDAENQYRSRGPGTRM